MILLGERSLEGEEWRPVVGCETAYMVSNKGRVYSRPRRGTSGGILSLRPDKDGYLSAALWIDNRQRQRALHRLMAEAFLPGEHEGNLVRHLNDDRTDNRLENLSWGTFSDNMRDAVANGRNHNAAKNTCVHGHEFTSENTRINQRGSRECRACAKRRDKAWQDRRRAVVVA